MVNPARKGFTMVELVVVLGIISLLFAITSLNITNTVPKTAINSAVQVLVSDLKQQQLNALTGQTEGRSSSDSYGIYFSGSKYILFHGNTFNANDTSNFDVNLDRLQITSTFPGNTIIFNKNSGDILNFIDNRNTITLTQMDIGQSHVINFNQYGIIDSIL